MRRHLVMLERLGLLLILRDQPMRDSATGRWYRRKTNRYVLTLARGVEVDPRQRPPAPTGHQRPVSPLEKPSPPPAGGGEGSREVVSPGPEPPTGPQVLSDEIRAEIAAARAALRQARPSVTA